MSVVLDASAAVQLVLNGPRAAAVRSVIEHEASILAPEIYVAEVANALWKYVRAGQLTIAVADALLGDAMELVTRLVSGEEIAVEALHEAARLDHPVYDLLYLICARRSAATLVTCDRRLKGLCETAGVDVAGV